MKAVILCAGKGERMMPLTANTPKPLLKVDGKPLIEYVLESLPKEIDEIIIVVKYLGDQIKKSVGRKYNGKKITYVTGSSKGNAYSFLNTKKHLKDERFLLIYGDETPNPLDVRNCLKKELSILTFKKDGVWINDGVMVLDTNIFYCPIITTEFWILLHWYFIYHHVVEVKSKSFVGEINTPEDITRVERILNG
jgi:UDP-N-acetylglucosamine diphosphorylase / glucose-1-phosphate thymidylyltransferase / UDP-N-acetylgalactosamine diphosphorylase / glucosamine-1-phosphate N-acetyltransferase / galactosamine-1-phosphate N-acetyltransferase